MHVSVQFPVRYAPTAIVVLLLCAAVATLRAQEPTPTPLQPSAAMPLQVPEPQVAHADTVPASMPAHPGSPGTAAARPLDADGPPSLELADLLVARGRYLAAIRVYGQLQPTTANIQNRMGVASERMLMFDQAQRCFEAAVKLDPAMANAWNNLGTVMHNRGDLRRAEKFYRTSIKLQPNNADAYQNLGALYYSKRNYHKGDGMYRQAMHLDPGVMERTAQHGLQMGGSKNQAEMHYHLASTFAQSGNAPLALEFLRKSIVEGFHDRNRLLHDPSFAELRTSEPFLKMVDDLKRN